MTANTTGSVTLSWRRPPRFEPAGYKVYTASGKNGPFSLVASTKGRSLTLNKLKPGTKLFYKVSAASTSGEGPQSAPAPAFTISPIQPTPFPAKIARNMCLTLNQPVVSDAAPIAGKTSYLSDGLDSTTCRFRKNVDLRLRINPEISFDDADYLLVNFRTHGGSADWSNNPFARIFRHYTISESLDSTDGRNGTWTQLVSGSNTLLDGVIVLPNHSPRWVSVQSTGGDDVSAADTRPMPSDLMLCRLDVFRSAPKGFRNDYWIFTGDSLIVQDMPGGAAADRKVWFSDQVRQEHPDRYPIVAHSGLGGEIMANTIGRMKKFLPELSPPNGTETPTATMLCFESGFNDVGVSAGPWTGERISQYLDQALEVCQQYGLLMIPVRIEFSTGFLNPETLEPKKDNVFFNTRIVNLFGVDVFARAKTPYAVNPETQLPYADYWTYTRQHYQTALGQDGVHHTKAGTDGINRLWANVADQMVYSREE